MHNFQYVICNMQFEFLVKPEIQGTSFFFKRKTKRPNYFCFFLPQTNYLNLVKLYLVSLFAHLVCQLLRKITHNMVQPNNSVNIWLKNPDIRIKRTIRLKSWIRFLLKRIQKSNIRIRLIRNQIPFRTIRIRL